MLICSYSTVVRRYHSRRVRIGCCSHNKQFLFEIDAWIYSSELSQSTFMTSTDQRIRYEEIIPETSAHVFSYILESCPTYMKFCLKNFLLSFLWAWRWSCMIPQLYSISCPYGIRDRFYSETFKLQTNFFEVIDQYRTATGWAIDRRWKSRLESFLWKSLTEQVSIRAFVDWTLPSCQNYAKRATFQFFDWQSEWYVWVLSHVYLVLYHLSITMARRQKSY